MRWDTDCNSLVIALDKYKLIFIYNFFIIFFYLLIFQIHKKMNGTRRNTLALRLVTLIFQVLTLISFVVFPNPQLYWSIICVILSFFLRSFFLSWLVGFLHALLNEHVNSGLCTWDDCHMDGRDCFSYDKWGQCVRQWMMQSTHVNKDNKIYNIYILSLACPIHRTQRFHWVWRVENGIVVV